MTTSETAARRHDRMVREEMEQAERVRTLGNQADDFWQTLARSFRPPIEQAEDASVDALAALIGPDDRVIDVGAGGGRIAVLLARRYRQVVAVEPSPAMRAVLEEAIRQRGVATLRIVPATWEEAAAEPAELVFASHVTYGIREVEPFLRKLDAHATRHAALVIRTDPPQTPFAPFWRAVYGEDRRHVPSRPDQPAASQGGRDARAPGRPPRSIVSGPESIGDRP